MQIVCPHCTTSFAIDRRALGSDGRTVRCVRCKGLWFALPADMKEDHSIMATAGAANARPHAGFGVPRDIGVDDHRDDPDRIPDIESPPIAADAPPADDVIVDDIADASRTNDAPPTLDAEAIVAVKTDRAVTKPARRARASRKKAKSDARALSQRRNAVLAATAAALMLIASGLLVFRAEVVRVLPQTTPFFQLLGLEVNLRGLAFHDIAISHDTSDGQPVLIVSGTAENITATPLDVPPLQLTIHDAKGSQLYTWQYIWPSMSEPTSLAPGARRPFRARLAAPPEGADSVAVRFATPVTAKGV